MSYIYRGPSIDAFYQVSVHLAKRFQRRRFKCQKLTDDGHQVIAKAQVKVPLLKGLTHHSWVKWHRNPRSYVMVLKHFHKS
jgi:hypothetical protein